MGRRPGFSGCRRLGRRAMGIAGPLLSQGRRRSHEAAGKARGAEAPEPVEDAQELPRQLKGQGRVFFNLRVSSGPSTAIFSFIGSSEMAGPRGAVPRVAPVAVGTGMRRRPVAA